METDEEYEEKYAPTFIDGYQLDKDHDDITGARQEAFCN